MIKRLRRRFVLIAAASVLAVELLVVGLINVMNFGEINRREEQLLNILCDNNGEFPEDGRREPRFDDMGEMPEAELPPLPEDAVRFGEFGFKMNEETRFQTRYFCVHYSSSGTADDVDITHVAAVTTKQAVAFADNAYSSGKLSGYSGNYRYCCTGTGDGKLYIFLDCRNDIETKNTILLISVAISLGGWILVCLLIIVLSKFAVKPFIENYEKQRMFITDAGHEIKTPLAIIQANTEVIEMTSEPSEWTQSIKNQTERLNGLIANLLKLSRMDEASTEPVFSDFCLTDAFIDIAQPFKTLAESKGLALDIKAEEGIMIKGDEGTLRQVVSILTENAVKYCDSNGSISASLEKTGSGRHAVMTVINDCKEPPENTDRLFDRFYRADRSRSRSDGEIKSGYGIGLSVAKAAVGTHKGKISCKAENGKMIFSVKLRCL